MIPMRRAALIGNPNSGKTTLFNALTGARQHVGNWPGVTVERISGQCMAGGTLVELVDLPGTYSLAASTETAALDERIASEYIHSGQADLLVNIVDASHLERHLYLTIQLLELGVPLILAVNMMDVAEARHIHLDLTALSRQLGCPVIALSANKRIGLKALKAVMASVAPKKTPLPLTYPPMVEHAIKAIAPADRAMAVRLLEANASTTAAQQALVRAETQEDADILIADTRYQFIQQCLASCLRRDTDAAPTWTERLDKVLLNRVLGIPLFLAIMYLLFVFAIDVGGYFQAYFDAASQAICVDGLSVLLTASHAPAWLIALLANGLGKGINTVVTFIPVIGAMFLFLAILEDSGYMARAAFVVDRFMGALGLPGKAFVPMIIGFGCNVPAVMAARSLEHQRDRILTVLMTPFMSCGARLAIYAVFAAAFFPHGGHNIVFALYMIGVVMAMLTGFLLQKTLLKGQPAPLMMELPAYHIPHMRTLVIHTWQRLKGFVFRAGSLIVPICMLIGMLNSFNVDGSLNAGQGDTHSWLSVIGQAMTPLFAPMGIHADNWPATVGLVTGVLAKEVVVGTLNTLYAQIGHVSANADVYGLMYQQFDGQVGAFAYLLFVLLYFPCVSTLAVMLRELHRGWTYFSAVWMIGAAYGVAVIFYQAATWMRHPESSFGWIMGMLSILLGTVLLIRWMANQSSWQTVAMMSPVRGKIR